MAGCRWVATLLAGFMLAAGAAGAEERREREVAKLGVNPAMAERWVAVKSEAAGARDLVAAAAQARYEEVWAFVPEQERWVEVGCCERRTDGGTYVGLETHLLNLMRDHPRLVIYHIHYPSPFVRENYHESRRAMKVVQEALPSETDMISMVKLTRMHRRLHPQGATLWRIASRHGLTTYGLGPAAREDDAELDYSRFLFTPFDEEELADMDGGIPQAVRRAVRDMDGDPFAISFSPLP